MKSISNRWWSYELTVSVHFVAAWSGSPLVCFQTGASLQQKADGWKEKVNDTRGSSPRTPTHLDQEVSIGVAIFAVILMKCFYSWWYFPHTHKKKAILAWNSAPVLWLQWQDSWKLLIMCCAETTINKYIVPPFYYSKEKKMCFLNMDGRDTVLDVLFSCFIAIISY